MTVDASAGSGRLVPAEQEFHAVVVETFDDEEGRYFRVAIGTKFEDGGRFVRIDEGNQGDKPEERNTLAGTYYSTKAVQSDLTSIYPQGVVDMLNKYFSE